MKVRLLSLALFRIINQDGGIVGLWKPHWKQEEFLNSKVPRLVFFGMPYGKSNWSMKEWFMREGNEIDNTQKPMGLDAGCKVANPYEDREPLYFDTTVDLHLTRAHYTNKGKIELVQGKNKIILDKQELDQVIRLHRQLIDYDAMRENNNKQAEEVRLAYLKEEIKHLEAQK